MAKGAAKDPHGVKPKNESIRVCGGALSTQFHAHFSDCEWA